MKRLWAPLLIAFLAAALFSGLLIVDFYKSLDSRLYDLMLRIRPGVEESPEILLLEVDDPTYNEVYKYPLPREIFADGLILMKEFEPGWTMLDIEFIDESSQAVDQDYLGPGVAADIEQTIDDITARQRELVENILSGRISRTQAASMLEDLEIENWEAANTLYDDFGQVVFSPDEHLGDAVAYTGDITVTVNMTDDRDIADPNSEVGQKKAEARDYARSFLTVTDYLNVKDDHLIGEAAEILPSIMPVLGEAAWAGFPRMHIDPDGVRRRIDILFKQDGEYYTHMGFGTWWVRQGMPEMTLDGHKLLVGDYSIPLDSEGKMLINWPKRLFDGTPLNRKAAAEYDASDPKHRLSFFFLYYHDQLMNLLDGYITELESYGVYSDLYGNTAQPLSAFKADLDSMRSSMLQSGDGSRAGDYGRYRNQYLAEAGTFFNSDAEEQVLRELESLLSEEGLPDEDFSFYSEAYQQIPGLFSECRLLADDLVYYREYLRDRIAGATVVVGYTGTSTSDYGANPFERKYMNMGIYGAVYNSLLQGEFISEIPLWMISLITLAAALVTALLSNLSRKHSNLNTTMGAVFVLMALAAAGAVFVFTDNYIHLLPLILALLTTYIASVVQGFMLESRNKAQIQSAFSQVISPDLVREIQENPELLQKRGENREITAMFTDIEAFSTISEHLGSPERIIELLERYLTPMSDIILEEGGTIDKYEGDAIIAFWNAPVLREDHVHRACRAAMRMVEKEQEIFRELQEDGIWSEELMEKLRARARKTDIHSPHDRLFTRIGINTGLNNVGFIGTAPRGKYDGRKDYTALGDGMNLAARLEGVNKQYGTQVLISGATEEVIHNHFITRRLDRIRVIGKEDVIPLYELSYFKKFPEHYYPEEHDQYRNYYSNLDQSPYHNTFTPEERQCFNYYRDAQNLFQEKDWNGAMELFDKILEIMPDDGPTRTFRNRCEGYIKKAPPKSWDGVYRMEFK